MMFDLGTVTFAWTDKYGTTSTPFLVANIDLPEALYQVVPGTKGVNLSCQNEPKSAIDGIVRRRYDISNRVHRRRSALTF